LGAEAPLTESAKLTLIGEIGLLTSADIELGYRGSSMSVVEVVMSALVVWCMCLRWPGNNTAKKCVAHLTRTHNLTTWMSMDSHEFEEVACIIYSN
jgi:hypothetical protein